MVRFLRDTTTLSHMQSTYHLIVVEMKLLLLDHSHRLEKNEKKNHTQEKTVPFVSGGVGLIEELY